MKGYFIHDYNNKFMKDFTYLLKYATEKDNIHARYND